MMKCSQMDRMGLAKAFKAARDDVGGDNAAVNMDVLAPYLQEQGSTCGTCPALLPLAKKAFEDLGNKLRAEEIVSKPKGLCGHARKHHYKADGIPDLISPPINGTPI